jgi:Zn-dependent protease with chaperone function
MATNSIPDQPQLSIGTVVPIFLLKLLLFRVILAKIFSYREVTSPEQFARSERKGSILAIIFFGLDVYLLDCQFYFAKLPIPSQLPSLNDLFCLILFVLYLSTMWGSAKNCYKTVFGREHTTSSFISSNLKTNTPIVLPWIIISLLADLILLAPIPALQTLLATSWGEPLILLSFFLVLIVIFPALIIRLWNCTPLPPGPHRTLIETFCKTHNVKYKNILVWPLFEGQALTAGVMGFVNNFRYILVTPALIKALTSDELEAVIAHEIGHIKRRHLQIYLLIFLGFGIMAQIFTYPLLSLVANSDLFYKLLHLAHKEPSDALAFASTVPMFLLTIIYFRYIMGYFMRNFERQADLYALKAMKSCEPLNRVFEKIAWLSGNIRDLPSWHHFSISQRINFLKKCEASPSLLGRHDRKVLISLIILITIFISAAALLQDVPKELIHGNSREKYAEAVINKKINDAPENPALYQLLGDLQYSRKKYQAAIAAYEQCLALAPDNHEALNNLAWLLINVEDNSLFDPAKALKLAKLAVIQNPAPYILDTLAAAYWHNGFTEQAILAEKRAIAQKPDQVDYYLKRLRKYQTKSPFKNASPP